MPYIQLKTNTSISKEQETLLKKEMGNVISIIGKSEDWLMLCFEDNQHMYFKGNCEQNMAFLQVMLYGKSSADAYQRLTEKLTQLVHEKLSILPENIYIKYSETAYWGYNSSNF